MRTLFFLGLLFFIPPTPTYALFSFLFPTSEEDLKKALENYFGQFVNELNRDVVTFHYFSPKSVACKSS
ncbi:MAG: hypothetical protein C5B49_09220 [Bdellovibrio sp.]|nr:MAG: hypothetical protein C5B49_09220 [Bdellovibrio sp.]